MCVTRNTSLREFLGCFRSEFERTGASLVTQLTLFLFTITIIKSTAFYYVYNFIFGKEMIDKETIEMNIQSIKWFWKITIIFSNTRGRQIHFVDCCIQVNRGFLNLWTDFLSEWLNGMDAFILSNGYPFRELYHSEGLVQPKKLLIRSLRPFTIHNMAAIRLHFWNIEKWSYEFLIFIFNFMVICIVHRFRCSDRKGF